MRWKKGRRSQNVDDRRGQSVKRSAGIGGGAVIIALLAAVLLGQDPLKVLNQMGGLSGGQSGQQQAPTQQSAADNEAADFVSVVLADTELVWQKVFAQHGAKYSPPTLVLYSGQTRTDACGLGQAAAGPFYCPGDYKVYIDLSFLGELQRLGAPGDFAFAYVIAHEVGHHIQNISGVATKVQQAKSRASKIEQNALQVRMELQADCYAGVWAHHAHKDRQVLETGDVEEGLAAAASVGDDHLQKSAGRRVRPETFTHGTSEQRSRWFYSGLESGDLNTCDTFS